MFRAPPKIVSVLCVIQTLAILIGYTLTRSAYKFYPMVVDLLGSYAKPIAWYTQLMLFLGPWLLLLPFAWGLTATVTTDTSGGIAEVSPRQMQVGWILSGVLAILCIISPFQMWNITWGPIR